MPTREGLLQIVNAKAAEAAIQKIPREAEAYASNYYELAAAGRFDDAADHLREAWRLDDEARKIAGAVQQAQPQSQFTAIEQDMLRSYPQVAADPAKWQTALAASRNLQLRGYDRNSPEYAQAVLHACGVLNSDFSESLGPMRPTRWSNTSAFISQVPSALLDQHAAAQGPCGTGTSAAATRA
jgi:hypothetical protein